jgi:signal transduction histidine kinase
MRFSVTVGPAVEVETTQRARELVERLDAERDGDALVVRELCDELEAARRQLLRLGLDLHDGPLQDIAALGTDLHLFRTQLGALLDGHEQARRATGRIDDLFARLSALDADLREIGISAEAGSLLHGPLSGALVDAADAYTDVFETTLDLDDGLDDAELTDSQRIALIRVAQSALANVAQHSGASYAQLRVSVTKRGLEAEIADNGRGFNPATETPPGCVGLAGMRERTRLLGGEFTVESEPGRGTTVRLVLPPYQTQEGLAS